MIRAFVALPVSDEAADALEDWAEPIPRLIWSDPQTYHVTLAFLGEAHPAVLADYDAALAGVRAPAFDLRAASRGAFGGSTPRTLFARIDDSPELTRLHGKVARALETAGFDRKRDRYRPHVTLARPGPRVSPAHTLAWAAGGVAAPPAWRATYFAFYRSDLTPAGPHYTELARYPLTAK